MINRFRGERKLFNSGRKWLEEETGIPVLGVMPWLGQVFPPEDSLDPLERKNTNKNADIEIAVIKLPSISNFSDLDPLEAEFSVNLKWIEPGNHLGNPDAIVIPGSKQTIKDLDKLIQSGLAQEIKSHASKGVHLFGICVRNKTLAVLSKYQQIKVTKETGFTTGRHGEELQGRDVFHVYLMGSEDKLISVFLNYEVAKSYGEKLSSATGLPFVSEVE